MNRNSFPPSITNLLLEEGMRFENMNGNIVEALGSGIISIVGTARSGKTSLAYTMLDYVIKYTKRPIILDSFPEKVMEEGIPDHWRGRAFNFPFEDIAEIEEPAVWLVDDTAANFNSRDAMASKSKMLARVAGVLSHFAGGMTVIFTTQMLSGVDISFFRYTNLATVIRYVDPELISHERPEWQDLVREGQYQLRSVSDPLHRDYYYSSKDNIIAESIFPKWLDKKNDPKKADLLSRPMRYHTVEDKQRIIGKKITKKKKGAEDE
jgi:hypothetical protein